MNPMLIVGIPLVLVIVGMVLNSIGLSFDQPPSSAEQDPAKRAAAEADIYRRFFDSQRKRAVARQKRVGQFAWLLIAVIIGSSIWLYKHTINATTAMTQVAALQTLAMDEKQETVLSLTLKGREQRQIPDQSAHSRSHGRRREGGDVETEGVILRHGASRHDFEYRRESIASRRRAEGG